MQKKKEEKRWNQTCWIYKIGSANREFIELTKVKKKWCAYAL